MRVMIVDDEPFIRKGLEQLIELSGSDCKVVAEAGNGIEALDVLKREKVDLIFADIKMPGMSGLDMIERIKKYGLSDAHIVILTGFADFELARRAMSYGIKDYLLKPIQTEELKEILAKAEKNYADRISQVYKEQKKLLMELLEEKENEEISESGVVSQVLEKQKDINTLIAEVKRNDDIRKQEKREIGYEVDEYIKQHYKENISLKQISERFHVNNVYLGQLFKRRHNMLFKDYIYSLRINDAENYLLNTNKRVYQIAEELGFANVDAFISRFVQIKGITPNQYRIKNKVRNEDL